MSRGRSGFLIVCILAFLVVGAGLERVRQAVTAPVPEVAPLPEVPYQARMAQPRPAGKADDPALRAAVDALRQRVAELEGRLAARNAELERVMQEKKAQESAPRRPGREDFRQRMEQLKKENPEQYAEMEKRREEFRQRMEQQEQSRNSFLASIDTQGMSEPQRENHEKLLATLARIDALRAQRAQANAEPGAAADEGFHQTMRESVAELGALYEQERTYLLTQAAQAAGYEGDDAATFVNYIQESIQSTTMPFGPPGGGPGAGGPPPGMP